MRSSTCLLLYFLFISGGICAQSSPAVQDSVIDAKYREDQFYLGITFNLLINKPTGMDQSGFSGGLNAGYIRDMPINKRRNLAIGIGAGFSMNTYNENLFIGQRQSGKSVFEILGKDNPYKKNWLTTYLIEAPVQLRWRTSTASTYKFWRIYTGLQLGYIYAYKANFEQPNNHVVQTDIPELNRFRMGTTFSFGYETFNFYFYYSLNPFFKGARLNGTQEDLSLNTFKLGLIFYLL